MEKELTLEKHDIAEMEMAPEIGVGTAHRIGDYDREQHQRRRRAQQRGTARPGWLYPARCVGRQHRRWRSMRRIDVLTR